jgi:hypothetical protein
VSPATLVLDIASKISEVREGICEAIESCRVLRAREAFERTVERHELGLPQRGSLLWRNETGTP